MIFMVAEKLEDYIPIITFLYNGDRWKIQFTGSNKDLIEVLKEQLAILEGKDD